MSGYLYKKVPQGRVVKSRNFPYYKKNTKISGNLALIGIGGNIGDTLRRFNRLFYFLQRDSQIEIVATSTILENPPFGFLEQPDFYNALILLQTPLSAVELLAHMQHIELHFGRKRSFKNAPRTLDLDIIAFNKQQINKGTKLIVPHPHYKERDSVTVPLESLKGVKWLKRVL